MKNVLAVLGVVMLLVGFALSSALFVYIAVFWFRADLFQVFVLLVLGLMSYGCWNTLGWWCAVNTSANTCLRDLEGNK
jgi:hypothetical protein